MKTKRLATILSVLIFVGCGVKQEPSPRAETPARRFPVPVVSGESTVAITNPLGGTSLPIVAVWQDSPGYTRDTNYPYLRIAVWEDGRVVFARDPNIWNHDLLLGQLPEKTLAQLKQNIRQTGVFDLNNRSSKPNITEVYIM